MVAKLVKEAKWRAAKVEEELTEKINYELIDWLKSVEWCADETKALIENEVYLLEENVGLYYGEHEVYGGHQAYAPLKGLVDEIANW